MLYGQCTEWIRGKWILKERFMETTNGILNGRDVKWYALSATTGAADTTATTAVTAENPTETTESTGTSAGNSTFAAFLQPLLAPDQANQVSEEELFAGVVEQRLKDLKGDEVAQKYHEALEREKTALRKSDGFIPYEEAAKNALKSLRSDETLTSEEADKVYSEAFAASQLDGNTEALWDNRGGPGDATMAMEAIQAAILRAETYVGTLADGSAAAVIRSLDETAAGKVGTAVSAGGASVGSSSGSGGSSSLPESTTSPSGSVMDGADGFLFKPISNNESRLAVLLPGSFKGLVADVLLKDSAGNVLDTGRSTGYGDTGEREKFAFSKQGGEYPQNITVEVQLIDGTTRVYEIPDPSQRYD